MEQNPSNENQTNEGGSYPLNKEARAQHKIFIAITAVIALIILITLIFVQSRHTPDQTPTQANNPVSYNEAIQLSTTGANQEPLREFVVDKLKNGENDSETRSAIYWITHRYFDNGGDIYEIYDFIESHPEVAFLKEAENIFPTVFEAMRARTVTNYSRESLLALLSYYEVIDMYGYANIGIWGLAANKYSEQAYSNRPNPSDSEDIARERARYFNDMLERAKKFINRSEAYLINQTLSTGEIAALRDASDIEAEDLLVGLNQHASALANLQGMNAAHPSTYSFSDIFAFTTELARTETPRLYFFTNYLFASALVQSGLASSDTVALPLNNVIEYAKTNTWRPGDSVGRVVNSKDNREASVFSYETAKALASLHVPFKIWLVENGWQESDF